MNSVDSHVLGVAAEWIREERPAVLVTLVDAWGSAPRPVGSLLAISVDGLMAGSVSGGCIEDDLIRRVAEYAGGMPGLPYATRYGVSADEARRFGLPCGGTLVLVVEPIGLKSGLQETLDALARRERVARQVDLRTGVVTVDVGSPQQVLTFDQDILRSVHGPRGRLLVIGAGPIAEYLVEMAPALDFEITVCDPRPEYQASWRRKDVVIDPSMPDDCVLAFEPDVSTAVVALTHDPKQDDLALIEALQSKAFYVGALGSRASQEKRRQRLQEFISPDCIRRLRGPVGLPIGSRTPPELAIAILADLVAVRNGIALIRAPEGSSGGPQ